MILESWPLFIEKAKSKYFENKIQTKFSEYLKIEYKNLCDLLKVNLPDDSNNLVDWKIDTFRYLLQHSILNIRIEKFDQST